MELQNVVVEKLTVAAESQSKLVDYANFEYTYEKYAVKVNEYCADHQVTVSNGYVFTADYHTDLASKQSV